jgi:hypothetical protein
MFKARLVLLALGFVTLIALPTTALAAYDPIRQPNNDANVCTNGGGASSLCNGGGTDPLAGQNGALVSVTSILAVVAGIVSIIFLVYGGVKYITSNGDSSGVSSAKSTIIAALIGLVIAALARPLITFVIGKL